MRKFAIVLFIFLIVGIFYFLFFPAPLMESIEPYPYQITEPLLLTQEEENESYLKDFIEIRKNLLLEKTSFIEANIKEMKMKVFKEGSLISEVPIYKRGNPLLWGGTSLGFYKILSKNPLDYSLSSGSYMPWSIRVYGKYYIHGDNYYPDGRIAESPITGGCIHLRNKDAKFIYDLAEVNMPVLVIDQGLEYDGYQYSHQTLTEFPELSANSYLVADLDSGYVFTEKNSLEKLPAFSLTKLMTAIVLAENIDLRRSILVTSKMLESPRSTEGLVAGKKIQVFELFWPLLVESSNDAAEVLSYFLDRERTIKLMNEKAEAILMKDTEFVDPSGLSAQNISTAQDLFYLGRYILSSRPMFLNISRGEEVWTFDLPVRFKNLENRNLFFKDPNFLGGKTGFIQGPYSTGLFIFRFSLEEGKERRIVIILSGSSSLDVKSGGIKNDTEKIISWLKENYFDN